MSTLDARGGVYCAQEDGLFGAARHPASARSVHRAHAMIGCAVGNATDIASTLAT